MTSCKNESLQVSSDSKPVPAWDLQIQLPEDDTSDDGDDDGDDGRYFTFVFDFFVKFGTFA